MSKTRPAIRIGCSGWNYRAWRGAFYPEEMPARCWFEYYSDRFDTVEINNSFYRLTRPETANDWRDQAPAGFCYAMKANRYITQAKKLKDAADPIDRMMKPARRLKGTLGPILYQLPPNFAINLGRLAEFLDLLPRDITHVFEFREPSWYVDDTLALLDKYDAGFVAHDFPEITSPRWACGKAAYVRFHGATGKYRGRYSSQKLRAWADWMIEQAADGRPVWAYFNNDTKAAAPADAQTLKRFIENG